MFGLKWRICWNEVKYLEWELGEKNVSINSHLKGMNEILLLIIKVLSFIPFSVLFDYIYHILIWSIRHLHTIPSIYTYHLCFMFYLKQNEIKEIIFHRILPGEQKNELRSRYMEIEFKFFHSQCENSNNCIPLIQPNCIMYHKRKMMLAYGENNFALP